jgi:ribosomal protein S18 acetylase RimI-like enzyme
MSDLTLREATPADEDILWEMLFYAAAMADDGATSADEARASPYLAPYVAGWGRPGDLGVVAEGAGGAPLGAAWLRLLAGDGGHPAVDRAYPELAIAVRPALAGRGLGGALLARLLELARPRHPGIVLSVRAENPARRLYERHGFVIVDEMVNRVGTCSYVMVARLAPEGQGLPAAPRQASP